MKITDALIGEHGLFQVFFAHLEITLRETDDLSELRSAARVFAALLAGHAGVEEDRLFPAPEPYLGEMGPLAVMRAEHEEIARYVAEMTATEDPAYLKKLISDLVQLCRSHFMKEEMALFPMARQFLGDEQLSRIGAEWAEARGVEADAPGCHAQAPAA